MSIKRPNCRESVDHALLAEREYQEEYGGGVITLGGRREMVFIDYNSRFDNHFEIPDEFVNEDGEPQADVLCPLCEKPLLEKDHWAIEQVTYYREVWP